MNQQKALKNIIISLLCSATLLANSGCYMHTFYNPNGFEMKNFRLSEPFTNNYRVMLEVDKPIYKNYSFNDKFDKDLKDAETLINTGSIYIYPEYQVEAKYDLKKTMTADFSEGSKGDGLMHGLGLIAEIAFNSFLIGFFGLQLQNDASNKKDMNYLNLGLFALGIFNFVYDITAYKVKEYFLAGGVKKVEETNSVASGQCDSYGINPRNFTEEFKEKYYPEKNKIALKNSILKFAINKTNNYAEIKTDESGRFVVNKETIKTISSKCLVLSEVKSDIKEAEKIKLAPPYIRNNSY